MSTYGKVRDCRKGAETKRIATVSLTHCTAEKFPACFGEECQGEASTPRNVRGCSEGAEINSTLEWNASVSLTDCMAAKLLVYVDEKHEARK